MLYLCITLNSNTMNKLHNADEYEHIKVFLNETDHPIAFGKLVKELVDSGLTESEAKIEAYRQPMEMEIYYEEGAGLMLVEPGRSGRKSNRPATVSQGQPIASPASPVA